MRITRLSEHSFQLTRLKLVNCYLVRESDGWTLIDSMIGGSENGILKAVQDLGGELRRIVLTHAHVDHVGSVDALLKQQPAVDLAASERSLPLLRTPPDKSLQPGEPQGKVKGGVPGIHAVPGRSLKDGELFGSLRVIATPGHIPGHLAFLDERDGTLYAGDALVGVGRLAISGYGPWYFPLPNLATWNKALARESAERLLMYPVERFACGHGVVRGGGLPLLRNTLARAR